MNEGASGAESSEEILVKKTATLNRQWTLASVVAFLCVTGAPITFGQQQINAQQIDLFKKTANDLCTTIKEARGRKNDIQIQGDVRAELNGLAGKLIGLGSRAAGSINQEDFEGLTRDATALALTGDRDCRERLFNRMFDKLSSNTTQPDKMYNPRVDIDFVGRYLNRTEIGQSVYISGNKIEIRKTKDATESGVYSAKLSDFKDKIMVLETEFPAGIDGSVIVSCLSGHCIQFTNSRGQTTGVDSVFLYVAFNVDGDALHAPFSRLIAHASP